MTTLLLIATLLIISIVLFYVVCSLLHPEIKANSNKYSNYDTRTRSNLLFAMDTDFIAEKISNAFKGQSNEKLLNEYEYFLHSIDIFCGAVPFGLSLIAFWICVSFDLSILITVAVCLIVFIFAIISLYIPKGTVITLWYHLVGTFYNFSNTLWLNKIVSIIILIAIGKPIMIIAFLIIMPLQLLLHLISGLFSVCVSGITVSDATAYNILGHIIHEHHTVFKWVKLNRQYIDENHENIK